MPDEPILPIDDPRLKQPSEAIVEVDESVRQLAISMFDVMDAAGGAGLAAVQIGIPKRLIVLDVPNLAGTRYRVAMVNPEIVFRSEETQVRDEGCLSLPGYDLPVERSATVHVSFLDLEGKPQAIRGDGILAICLQHEVDHTDGVLFTDRVSPLRRSQAQAHFRKVRRRAA